MNRPICRLHNVLIALALSCCFAEHVLASAFYDSNINLSYSISLLSSTNPLSSDRAGLTILGTFQQPSDVGSFYAAVTGDGQYQSYSTNPTAAFVSNLFNGAFSVGGSAALGSVDSFQTGLFGLEFSNSSSYSYSFAISLDYVLQAIAHGEFANSSILFDYWNQTNTISGSDAASAASFTGNLDDQQSVANSATWNFTLAPGTSEQFYAQAGIESHLQSADTPTTVSVPIPAVAEWLFGSALTGMSWWFSRRKVVIRSA